MVYAIIFSCALFNITIPYFIINTAQIIGQANIFLPLFLIGLMMNFDIPKEDYMDMVEIMGFRLVGNLFIIAIMFYFIPLPLMAKQIVMLALLAPMANASPIFVRMFGYKGSVSANASSLGIFISIISIIIISFFLG